MFIPYTKALQIMEDFLISSHIRKYCSEVCHDCCSSCKSFQCFTTRNLACSSWLCIELTNHLNIPEWRRLIQYKAFDEIDFLIYRLGDKELYCVYPGCSYHATELYSTVHRGFTEKELNILNKADIKDFTPNLKLFNKEKIKKDMDVLISKGKKICQ